MPFSNDRAKQLILDAKLSLRELETLSGVARRNIGKFENGDRVNEEIVRRIADGLTKALGEDIHPEELVLTEEEEVGMSLPKYEHSVQAAEKFYDFYLNYKEYQSGNEKEFRNRCRKLVGDTIRNQLRRIHRPQRWLAERINTSNLRVSDWIHGGSLPRPDRIATISELLDIDLAELQAQLKSLSAPTSPPVQAEPNAAVATLWETAEAIPDQNPLIKFGVSGNVKLRLVPALADENDYDTIEALRSELLAPNGPLERLSDRYEKNPNDPQSELFKPITSRYREELAKDPREINYAILYARGARFYAARRTATQQVKSNEWPEPGADETDAIDAVCDLHGPLIMASAVGRRIVTDGREYESTPDVYREEEDLLKEFGDALTSDPELFEPKTAEAIKDVTDPIPNDPQPARSRATRLVLAGSALVAIIGGAAWLAAGGGTAAMATPAGLVGLGVAGVAASLGGRFAWEVFKKTDWFSQNAGAAAKHMDAFIKNPRGPAVTAQRALLQRMSRLVEQNPDIFERISKLRPEFGWAEKFIKPNTRVSDKEPVNLGGIVRSAAFQLIEMAQRNSVKITEDGLNSDAIVLGNRLGLHNVFYNLILNAIVRHRSDLEPGKTIDISLRTIDFSSGIEGSTHVVSVRDNGSGIHPEDRERIFKPGFRNASSPQEGTGYGLYLAKKVIDEHDGSIELSATSDGIQFFVSLPAYKK